MTGRTTIWVTAACAAAAVLAHFAVRPYWFVGRWSSMGIRIGNSEIHRYDVGMFGVRPDMLRVTLEVGRDSGAPSGPSEFLCSRGCRQVTFYVLARGNPRPGTTIAMDAVRDDFGRRETPAVGSGR
jgi:hypothetical protein